MAVGTSRELLLLTHLYYDAGARPWRDRALASVIIKLMYSSAKTSFSEAEITQEVASFLKVASIPSEQISASLVLLKKTNAVKQKKNQKWELQAKEIERIQQALKTDREEIENLLANYFSIPEIDPQVIRSWFIDAVASFFEQYCDSVVGLLDREKVGLNFSTRQILEKTLKQSIKDQRLQEYSERLTEGFRAFLDDATNPTVASQIWSFAQTMFAARILNVSIGPDPLSIEQFRGATFYLDTNVLLLAALEHSELASSFEEFAKSLSQIGATLHLIPATKEEYDRVVAHKRDLLTKASGIFSTDFISRARDPFLITARGRGCTDSTSLSTFFDQLERIPLTAIPGVEIIVDDNQEVHELAERGVRTPNLSLEIASEWRKSHAWEKKGATLAHDVALASVCRGLRSKGGSVWVITADRSMQSVALRWAGKKELPAWVSLDALIQIMALTGAGPGHNPSNFAPIFSSLLSGEILPRNDSFRIEDLIDLSDHVENLKELPDEEMEKFAIRATHLVVTGQSPDEVVLEIRRAIHAKRINSEEAMKKQLRRAIEAEQRLGKSEDQKKQLGDILVNHFLVPKFMLKIILKRLRWLLIAVIGSVATWFFANWIEHWSTQWSYVVRMLILPEMIAGIIKTALSINGLKKMAEQESKKEIGRLVK